MNYDLDLLSIPIKDVASHIFRRPYLFVNLTAHMLQIASFLAIGPLCRWPSSNQREQETYRQD
jgi:hypothetical protein